MIQQTEIKFMKGHPWGDFEVLWCVKHELGKSFNGYLKDGIIQWQEVQEGAVVTNELIPFLKVPRYFPLQELIDALTNTKKATEQIETLSELKATKYHLEDMRKLVFDRIVNKEILHDENSV